MKKTQEPRMTAGHLLRELQSDPEWVAKREQQEDARRRRAAELRAVEAPLVTALRDAGIAVKSVWDLVNTAERYPAAIPVLLAHLEKPYPDEIAAGIGRALAVDDARPHWRRIIAAYEDADGMTMPQKKDALACAVAATADVSEVIRPIENPAHGDSRLFLLLALRRSRDPKAAATVRSLAREPLFAKEIASWRRHPD